jgi:CubicO group peptidase (beta-lactamase class C family)
MLSRRLFSVFVGLVLAVGLCLRAWSPSLAQVAAPALAPEAIDAYLRAQVAANHIPGLAVAVVKDNQVLMLRGYGEAQPGQPVTPQTQFYIGSLTKSFTALAVMRLVQEGQLELDAPVQRYLPWFKVAEAQASAQITVRHLLNHTSGLSEAGDPNANQFFTTIADGVRAMHSARLTAPVGTKFQYYNQNYRVLGVLIEQVSGETYADYLQTHILTPLGLTHTTTRPAEAAFLAAGHGQVFGWPLPRTETFQPSALPSGYLISSAEDLAQYLKALLHDTQLEGGALLSPPALAQLFMPPDGIQSAYGMGWMMGQDASLGKFYYHDGTLENYHAELLLVPQAKVGVAILVNQGGLMPQLTSFPALLLNGIGEFLIGNTPKPASFAWLGWLLALVAAVDLGVGLFRLWRLPQWARKADTQRRWVRWFKALADLILPLGLLVGLPLLLGALLGGKGGWPELFGLLPDVAGWLMVSFAVGAVRGTLKVGLLTRAALR